MERRNFITNVTLTLTGIATMHNSLGNASTTHKENKLQENNFADDFELNEVTITELQEKMASGKLSSEQITQLYLKRIDEVDKKGPAINAVIEINPDAISIAKAMDDERKAGKVRSALHGIPVLLKDNIDTGDKMMTTAGSIALLGNIALQDAFIIKQLRKSGAVILGKTNLSEWANFRSTRSCSGWSSRGGQTKNPNMLDRSTSGSSAGSGAAVAANLCAIAIGTETNGSICAPAAMCGIVGIKPTVGLWSRSGIIPVSATQDTAGPMTRTVKDAAILLGVLCGVDEKDTLTKNSIGKNYSDYTKFLDANGLKGKRIGIDKSYMKKHEGVDDLVNMALKEMKKAGAEIVEIEPLLTDTTIGDAELAVLCFEFKDGLNHYLSESNSKLRSLKEIIEFNQQNETKSMPFFKQEIFEMSETKGNLKSQEYLIALEKTFTGSQSAIDASLKKYNLDAICELVAGPANCIDMVNGDYGIYYNSGVAAMAGYPHITVPAGMVFGLPVGLNFFGTAYSESTLISIGYAFEQASMKRAKPDFKNTFII